VDAALLGVRERGLSGEGVLATVTFRARAAGDPRIGLAKVEARDPANQPVALGARGTVPGPATATMLMPAVPNPFNRATALSFSLAQAGPVELAVYSVDGRKVKTLVQETREAGAYRLVWDGTDERGMRCSRGCSSSGS